jgi:hypothetical protein
MVNLFAQVCALITSPTCTTVVPGQLSETVTAAVVGPGTAAAQLTVTLAGQVIDGGCVSLTVTVNVQVGPALLVTVTVVVPTAKNEPEAGLLVTVPQVPLVIGAG